MEGAGDSFTSAPTTTRLHITPLDPDLLKVIVPAKVIPIAANISYHTLETFPEKRYGFVDLPTEEADRIKKKLNNAVLKGVKIRIEKARQRKEDLVMARRKEEEERSGDKEKKTKKEKAPKEKKDRSKKRKRDDEEIVGVELEEGRKVKRGWTVSPKEARETKSKDKSKKKDKDKEKSKDKKKRREQKSVYTEGPECLIRAVLPAAAASADQDGSVKKRKKKDKTVVIHEFKKTKTFPTFLKSSTSSKSVPTEYVEGTGWVDQDGNVVEAVRSTRSTGRKRKEKSPSPDTSSVAEGDAQDDPEPTPAEPDAEDTTSSSGSDTSSDEESEEEASNEMAPPKKLRPDSISIPESPSPTKDETPSAVSKTHSPRPKSASSVMSLTIKIPPATPVTPGKASVHPLEALYKRPKPDGKEAAAVSEEKPGFTFFGGEDFEDQDMEDEGDSGTLQPPMTPFTRQDWEHRNIRSAAPTPDTAHHNRSFKFWPPPGEEDDIAEDNEGEDRDDDNEADDNNGSTSGAAGASGDKAPTSDFQKWFWENRGDLNRSWKKRRKLAGKEKRYRENRSRASRAI
ncbi:hypothetical protein PspLS_10861 [Pyricularia sp. CBS 133598]|nr:hypothetical protein PspLS_10861 [Pyricularia sp. CBS 133598]